MTLCARLKEPSERGLVVLDLSGYDRSPELSPDERAALERLCERSYLLWGDGSNAERRQRQEDLRRLVEPLQDAICRFDPRSTRTRRYKREAAIVAILRCCRAEGSTFWGWSDSTWRRILGNTQAEFEAMHGESVTHLRLDMMVAAYALGCFRDVVALGRYRRSDLALRVFGAEAVNASCEKARVMLEGWGYAWLKIVHANLLEALLIAGSPHLEDLTNDILKQIRVRKKHNHSAVYQLGLVLAELGVTDERLPRLPPSSARWKAQFERAKEGIDPRWLNWIQRWCDTTTVEPRTQRSARPALWKAGRWLARHHPNVAEPQDWTRDIAMAFVAAVMRMRVGDYVGRDVAHRTRAGNPLAPRTIDHLINDVRRFFVDCQHWEWIPCRFDPHRVLVTPKSVRAKIAPNPRVLLDSTWAKLLWAGLNLGPEDLPGGADGGRGYYPIELYQALASVWLFAGLRSDEIVRLRSGCVRWQQGDADVPGTDEVLPKDAVCLLDVPIHKTGRAYTKPVDPAVGKAIAAWEAIRPEQPLMIDAKTSERVPFLFCYRGKPLHSRVLNRRLIPMLCRKAGVPTRDARGRITSHRARATIATQLYNAREPMSLFDLQKWLGHERVQTTASYVAISPTKLAKSYADAGYFERNVRAIEVLIDQDAVKSGASIDGASWRYYELGHGCCSYDFFDQCPHRMACVRCDFYVPKESSTGQILEAKAGLQRLIQEIPLTDDERAAVDGDLLALDRLTAKLREVSPPCAAGERSDAPPEEA